MNKDIKKAILYSAGVEGFFADAKNFIGLNLSKERNRLLDSIRDFASKVATHVKDGEAEKLVNEIKSRQVCVEIVENFEQINNKKRMSKMTVKIKRGMLETIAEEATRACKDCTRIMKKCKLRVALIDCNIERYHDEEGICQYKQ